MRELKNNRGLWPLPRRRVFRRPWFRRPLCRGLLAGFLIAGITFGSLTSLSAQSPSDVSAASAGSETVPPPTPADDSAPGTEDAPGSDFASDAQPTTAAGPGPSAEASSESVPIDMTPVLLLVVGIVSVLAMIIGLKLNAFLALIISALIVSLGVGLVQGEPAGVRMGAVVEAFGKSAGGIGIVIAMAAIIGKCMLDSGSADRIVHSAIRRTGEKKAALGLMVSGFILAIPVFFDTVFYLLVPLARSLYARTQQHYLRYLMAIATGGAITHTLVPPTPGPLLMAAILGVDLGWMMFIGVAVAIPAALVGLAFSVFVDARMPIPMRSLGAGEVKHQPLPEQKLPPLGIALIPVLLPVLLILAGTVTMTLADAEDRAAITSSDLSEPAKIAASFSAAAPGTPAARVLESKRLNDGQRDLLRDEADDDVSLGAVAVVLDRVISDPDLYDELAFAGVDVSPAIKKKAGADKLRMKPVDVRRVNRTLLEASFPEWLRPHQWDSGRRKLSDGLALWSNPNFALLLAALAAMLTLKRVRQLSWQSLGEDVEESLMSGGVIILITAAGGAFGAMLTATEISGTIKDYFSASDYFSGSGASGVGLLLLAFGIAAVLKVAQGSSTVAMIIGAGMMSAIIADAKPADNMVYVATAVGSGSLMGSWMNDSGFWVFTKMGGLTEKESLRSWTPLLVVLSLTGLVMTLLLSQCLPMRVDS